MNTMTSWKCRDRLLELDGCPLIMGILNVTPDSFSDGGLHADVDSAIEHGMLMIEEGADIIDVGGESTRPGSSAVSHKEELTRVIPVIKELSGRSNVALSVDTSKALVAREAMQAGAHIINDVSAFSSDADMWRVAKEFGAGVVLMHMLGSPRTMQENPSYDDVAKDVADYLKQRVGQLTDLGLDAATIAVDPGIGFGKTIEHNVKLLASIPLLAEVGQAVVVGLSRKSFLGILTDRPVGERLAGSLAALTFCVEHGAHVMRVHDVAQSRDAARVAWALGQAEGK